MFCSLNVCFIFKQTFPLLFLQHLLACLAVLNRWELFLLYTRSKVCLVYCKLSCLWRTAPAGRKRQFSMRCMYAENTVKINSLCVYTFVPTKLFFSLCSLHFVATIQSYCKIQFPFISVGLMVLFIYFLSVCLRCSELPCDRVFNQTAMSQPATDKTWGGKLILND